MLQFKVFISKMENFFLIIKIVFVHCKTKIKDNHP